MNTAVMFPALPQRQYTDQSYLLVRIDLERAPETATDCSKQLYPLAPVYCVPGLLILFATTV